MRMRQIFTKILLIFMLGLSSIVNAAAPMVYSETSLNVTVTKDQPQFVIQLKSNPTTGYSWFLRSYDKNLIQPVRHSFQRNANKNLMGAGGTEVWIFRVKPNAFDTPQQTTLQFEYARPWEKTPAQKLSFGVTTLK